MIEPLLHEMLYVMEKTQLYSKVETKSALNAAHMGSCRCTKRILLCLGVIIIIHKVRKFYYGSVNIRGIV